MKKELQVPEEPHGPYPVITPEMIRETFRVLEEKGMVYYSEGGIYVPTEAGWKLLMEIKPQKVEIHGYGHPDILATNTAKIRITQSNKVTDDCIAVNVDKIFDEFDQEFLTGLKVASKIHVTIEAGGITDYVTAFGSPALKLTDKIDMIIRKNDYIDGRTLAILADKSASELKRELIEKLKDANIAIKITFEIKS